MTNCNCSGPVAFHGPDTKNLVEIARLVKHYNKHYRKQSIDSIVSYLNGIAWTYGQQRDHNPTFVGVSGVIFTYFNGHAGREVKLSIDPVILPIPKARKKKVAA